MLEESAEDLYENAPCGYLSTAPDGVIVRVNATFLRWTGYRREELVGVRRFQDLLTGGGRIYHETHFAPLLRMQGRVREIALDIVGADGGRLPVLVNSVLITDTGGAAQLVRTTVLDATERKRYEHELLQARNRERLARERIERLQRITAAIAAAADAGAIAQVVSEELVAAFEASSAGITVNDGASDGLRVVARHGDCEAGDPDATIRLPLGGAPAVDGYLWVAFDEPRSFEPDERAFTLACAEQAGLALERARLYEEQRNIALLLQRSLVAGDPPADERFDVAALYRPAVEQLEVGGDWHDVFGLPGGKVGVVVGDVVGRGLRAATAMGQLRSAVRALAGAGLEPAAVLEHLDTFVDQVHAARYATIAFAEVAPDSGMVCFASAGHLPPVLVAPERTPELFMDGRSPPLGVRVKGEARDQAAFALAPGAGFLLYTDGLVERRDEPIDAGLERLTSAVRARRGAAPHELVEALPPALLAPAAHDDDVCVLCFRRRPTAA
jgi:PAS domain S-box-containing protein